MTNVYKASGGKQSRITAKQLNNKCRRVHHVTPSHYNHRRSGSTLYHICLCFFILRVSTPRLPLSPAGCPCPGTYRRPACSLKILLIDSLRAMYSSLWQRMRMLPS